uniref:Ig-like domain-containing protein n=1 Tax=Oreochromis niloticus TaxID=8128 RepID=A0A669B9G4_ORENI
MGATLLCELGLFLLCTLLCTGHGQDAVLTIEPNWSSFFIGEFVTFKCDMKEGEDTDWYYKITKDSREFLSYRLNNDHTLQITSTGDNDEYQCFGHMKGSYDTKISNTVSITVSAEKPSATLTAVTTIIPVEGNVTLTCSVNPSSSSGWKYYWYRDEKSSEALTTQDAVFHSNGQISVSQEGLYRCRGGRGNPVYYTEDSQEVHINTTGEFGFSNNVEQIDD